VGDRPWASSGGTIPAHWRERYFLDGTQLQLSEFDFDLLLAHGERPEGSVQ
jgi:hypothetical protein